MNVIVSVHGRFHAFELAAGLHERGALDKLATTYPMTFVRRATGQQIPIASAWWLEIARRFGFDLVSDITIARSFAKFSTGQLSRSADLVVGWSGATLEAIPRARALGLSVMIERGSTHICHQREVLEQLERTARTSVNKPSNEQVEREVAEYEAADAVCVPTQFARETFIRNGVPESKVFVNHFGVDLDQFHPGQKQQDHDRPLVLFVGRIGHRKGVPELLEAYSQLQDRCELRLVGPLEAGCQSIADKARSLGVEMPGAMPRERLVHQYREADIFCLPSWEEGFPLVIPQALASGAPVVASRETGLSEIAGAEACSEVFEAGDVEGLVGKLVTLLSDVDRRQSFSESARPFAVEQFNWDAYVDRAMQIYASVIDSQDPVGQG